MVRRSVAGGALTRPPVAERHAKRGPGAKPQLNEVRGSPSELHVPVFAQQLHAAALILGAAGAFGDRGQLQLFDQLVDVLRRGLDPERARRAAETPISGAIALVEVQVDDLDVLQAYVFPDIDLPPVEERVDADVRAGWEAGLELV